jgi:hypothetical protein
LGACAASRIVRVGTVKVHAVMAEYRPLDGRTLDDHSSEIAGALTVQRNTAPACRLILSRLRHERRRGR